jgi:TRAP-type C4-dicarboxylate transport system permease small subunit
VTAAPVNTGADNSRISVGIGMFDRLLKSINRLIVALACVALVAAALVLTESVAVRYFFQETTDWQNETCVMLLVGAMFLSAAYVQEVRGHIGIEAFTGLLPIRFERLRKIFVDAASLAFCAFFAWKSWTLSSDALLEGIVTDSTFAPPLWIPYTCMALGMTLLSVQIGVQLVGLTWKAKA